MKSVQEPEKIDVKIGSKEEEFLTMIKEALEKETLQSAVTARINREFLKIVDKEIAVEKEKFK